MMQDQLMKLQQMSTLMMNKKQPLDLFSENDKSSRNGSMHSLKTHSAKFSEAATLRLFRNDNLLTQIREETRSERDSAPSLNSKLSNSKSANLHIGLKGQLNTSKFKDPQIENDYDQEGYNCLHGQSYIAKPHQKKNDDIVSDQGFWMNSNPAVSIIK